MSNFWKNKNVLFIGDSITASKEYPKVIEESLGINVFYHCKSGADIVSMVDGERGLSGIYNELSDFEGILRPLTADSVRNMDLIVFFGGYNNILYGGYNGNNCFPGNPGDLYNPDGTGQDTLAGIMQYAIERIYEELARAKNTTCRILIVTVDCAGKNKWINVDGCSEIEPNSGKSYKNYACVQKAVAEINLIPCCDLFHTSGINKHTWCCFGAESESFDPHYTMYPLNEAGEILSNEFIKYEHGKYYYQIRNNGVILEQYNEHVPYPYNRDQLHKSSAGYQRIGEVILGAIISAYGI